MHKKQVPLENQYLGTVVKVLPGNIITVKITINGVEKEVVTFISKSSLISKSKKIKKIFQNDLVLIGFDEFDKERAFLIQIKNR